MKPMKFRVKSPEHSVFIQKKLFEMGYNWSDKGGIVFLVEEPFLFAGSDGSISSAGHHPRQRFFMYEAEDMSNHPEWQLPEKKYDPETPKEEERKYDVNNFVVHTPYEEQYDYVASVCGEEQGAWLAEGVYAFGEPQPLYEKITFAEFVQHTEPHFRKPKKNKREVEATEEQWKKIEEILK